MHAAQPGRSADELTSAQAGPNPPTSDLLGRQPVRVRAEGTHLAAYGFGHQRVVIPAADIGSVVTHDTYSGGFWTHGAAMVVLDRDDRMLLRAKGAWGYADLTPVLDDLGLGRPVHLTRRDLRKKRPRWDRAPGFRRLRVRPRGYSLYVLALIAGIIGFFAGGLIGGAFLGVAVPQWFGAIRILIGIAGAAAGATLGLWLMIRGGRLALGAVRWAAYSASVRSPAPAAPFFPRRERTGAAQKLKITAMVLAVPALIGWGPGVLIATVANGFASQALVTTLRHDGVPVPGRVIDVPSYSTDSDGNTTITDHAFLSFPAGGTIVQVPDPDIAGLHWPIDPAQFVTVVFNPADPQEAAVSGQLTGSPWHGIPTANLISGSLLTVALPLLAWRLRRAIAASRRAKSEDFLDGMF